MAIKKQFLKSKPVCKVTFSIKAEEAENVPALGSFYNWSETATPLKKLKNETLKEILDLE